MILLMMLLTALLLNGCDSKVSEEIEPIEEMETVEVLQPAEGGNLKLPITRFTTANPLFNSNRSLQQIQHLIYEGLVTLDNQMDIEPVLAKEWRIVEGGQSIDFVLRNDVKWHDGEPFTAEDVLFTFQLIKGNFNEVKNASIYRSSLQQVLDMKVIEDNVVRVTFTRPYSNGLEVMAFPILPRHLFKGDKINNLINEDFPIVGTGPYQLEEHLRMKSLHFKKNANYWGNKPYIDTIEVVIVPDREAKLSLFEHADVDFARPASVDWGRYSDNKKVNVYEFVSNNYEFLGFNFRNKLLQRNSVRKAFAYGIDRHKLVKNIYLNHATVTEVPVNPESWLYNDFSLQYGYDINKAQSILEEQGFILSEDKSVRKNEEGESLKFRLITNKENLLREKAAYLIQEEMEAVGIQLEVVFLEWKDFNEALEKGNFDIVLGGWELSPVPDLTFAFHSSQIGRTNFIAYENEEMDFLLDKASRDISRQGRLQNYQKLQQHIANEIPYLSLCFQNNAILLRDHVKGDKQPNNNNVFRGIENWFINTK